MTTGKSKTILVTCGRAISTSMFMAEAIKESLAERGMEVETKICKTAEVANFATEADLVVSTAEITSQLDIPVIVTLAFLTGMGKERVIQQIVHHLS